MLDPDRPKQCEFQAPEVQILDMDPSWCHHLQHWLGAVQALVSGHHSWSRVHVWPSGIRWNSTNKSIIHNSAISSTSWVCLLDQQGPGSSMDSWVILLIIWSLEQIIAEQPKYIQSIVGYSPTTGRTYFKDKRGKAYLSSFDGVRMDVVNPSNMATVGLLWLTFVSKVIMDRLLEMLPLSLLWIFLAMTLGLLIMKWPSLFLAATMQVNYLDYCFSWRPSLCFSARYDGIVRASTSDVLARWSSCCGKPA